MFFYLLSLLLPSNSLTQKKQKNWQLKASFELAPKNYGGNFSSSSLDPEILAGEGLSKLPVWRSNVPGSRGAAVAAGDPEGEGLTDQDSIGLPVLAPVSAHAHPPCSRSLNTDSDNVTGTGNVGDQDKIEVTEAINGEPDSPMLAARDPVTS